MDHERTGDDVAKDDPKVEFGRGVRALREARGLTQTDLAERSGLGSWKYVGTVENARTNITMTNLAKLATGLDLSIADLFTACFPAQKSRADLLSQLVRLVADGDDRTIQFLLGVLREAKKWRGAG